MLRVAAPIVLAIASALVVGDAAAHPGHATPHLLHETDAIGTWWIVGAVLSVGGGILAIRKSRP